MILNERDEQDLLHAVSLIRRILKAHGVIDRDIPASVKRCAEEITTHAAQQDIPPEPEPLDREINNDSEEQ